MKIVILGIDLGKTVCSMAGLDETGQVVLRKRVRRDRLGTLLVNLPPCTVAMEACCGAHHVGRQAQTLGHAKSVPGSKAAWGALLRAALEELARRDFDERESKRRLSRALGLDQR